MSIEYRRAEPNDYPAILDLQSANFIANLGEEEQREGFLSAQFSPEQTAQIAQDLGTMVAVADGRVAGFLCAFRNEFETGSPVIAHMIASYDRLIFDGQPLSAWRSYIYGPVCIAKEFRRRGLLRGLYEAQKKDLAGQFDIGVAFVARNNPHSLNAHAAGLGMSEAGDFTVKDNIYATLVFRLPAK
jgi:predicted GNAT superfamily acetyltransferase